MTFSLVARCAETGMFGIAIASSSPAVAARCAHTRAGVGAVASQNITDPSLGPLILDAMQNGMGVNEAINHAKEHGSFIQYRQLLAVDANGKTAIHSGPNALGIWGHAAGEDVVSGGNLLAHADIPAKIVQAFAQTKGHLAERLLNALKAGLDAGGEAGPVHSAGVQVADKMSWPLVDLRCDWSDDCPVKTLIKTWEIYKPQMEAYVQRALDPRAAPAYGVPGDM